LPTIASLPGLAILAPEKVRPALAVWRLLAERAAHSWTIGSSVFRV
jgi:hypothetical protein